MRECEEKKSKFRDQLHLVGQLKCSNLYLLQRQEVTASCEQMRVMLSEVSLLQKN